LILSFNENNLIYDDGAFISDIFYWFYSRLPADSNFRPLLKFAVNINTNPPLVKSFGFRFGILPWSDYFGVWKIFDQNLLTWEKYLMYTVLL